MFHATDDLRISELRPLISPAILIEEIPVSEKASTCVWRGREAASAIVKGQDDRLLVVVGPCSIHDPAAAVEYAGLLKPQADRLADDLCVVLRVYFEKPRTTVGWKGLINDPDLDGSFNINRGLHRARALLRLGDWSMIPRLIEGLDHESFMVRTLSLQALKEATHEDFDYHPGETDLVRRFGVVRWEEWWSARSSDPILTGGG